MENRKKPLEGVKVVELATFIAAATTGRFLADLGADVIKIESAKGDPLRYTAPSEGRPLDMYENTTWELENANKRCLSINTRDERGKEALFKLLEDADILITNWRVGALQRAGLDYETLKKKFPKLVYGIITGYGEFGPDKDLPGFDFTSFFARGGYLETLRQKDDVPFNVVPGVGDHNVGMNLACGLLAALYHAKMTGEGEKVETSLFETAIFNMGMMVQAAQYPDYGSTYPINVRESNNPFLACWKSKDGRYVQTCMPDYNTYFERFMTALGLTQYLNDDRYFPVTNLQENKLGPDLYDAIMERFGTKTLDEWNEILVEADIPFALAKNWEEILEDEQAWANNCFYKMDYPNGERILVNQPVRYHEMGATEYNKGPLIGEHSVEVLKELGYSDEEIQNMLDEKVAYVWDK
ncbi:Formyl-coenzyme A transferase [Aedoeadaptatus ivorii]|uniref:Formyl-coenzyme A transferase n=1 Tax=Aedoeadaptatus ivorii TaxID=54006 RepID=A0A3S5F7S1_9FIRM|nr:CaiB/BaiF CoA-transferase family protein [Peptoniphilus ivorii]MDQ0508494.1 cinnamoyl-CoA:phenyllactate CoA-transferase [Peptoniphilus ivorii]VEJ34283.1 Formyl-coenzyme A transferase [Peptoniphilus ivorii]